jgi:hypothetical protein
MQLSPVTIKKTLVRLSEPAFFKINGVHIFREHYILKSGLTL